MGKILRSLVLVLTCSLLSGGVFAQHGKLIIEMEGFRNDDGNVRLGLYNSEEDFLKDGGSYKRFYCEIEDGKCVVDTGELPFGEYAVALLHDENLNKKMDYSWMKIPKEGFGFSNNPKVKLSAPSFSDTKVTLDVPEKRIKITVKYM
ncbi:DUF2141 domain-containing protein [Cytophagaceae bacterium ABcell3]|nr:DUF2141 domain-containing protein [Cytophagaceae bacterium ABcell3]